MSKFRFRLIVMLICIFAHSKLGTIHAQESINFKHITIEEGLSQSTVEVLYQDTKGYIWIGTNDGLDRYNGHEIKTYKKNKDNEKSLAGNYIIDIVEDKNGDLWVGTTSGLSKINLNNDYITNYTSELSKGNLSDNNICEILVTDSNDILVATNNGLNLYDRENDKFTRILDKEGVLTSQSIYTVEEDKYGNLWIGTDEGLNKIDVKNKTVKNITSTTAQNSISDDFVYKLYSDNDKYLWVGTVYGGLNKINIDTDQISVYKNDKNDETSLAGDFVRNIIKTRTGQVWICTSTGISKYNEKDENFTSYTNVAYDKYSLIDNNTFSIIEDKNGLIFIGTYKGISMFDPNNKIEHYKNDPFDENSISDNLIHGIYEDDKELLWIGTNSKGINIINRKTNNVDRISEEDGLTSNFINTIVGKDDSVWIGTQDGLNKIDIKSKQITTYNEGEGLKSSTIKSLCLDRNKYLWIGTTDGIFVQNIENENIYDVTYILKENSMTDTYVETIYIDNEKNIWIGTFVEGNIIKINEKEDKIISYTDEVNSNSIRSIGDDSNNVWIGTSDGLFRFDKNREQFISYTEEDGISNNTIYGILVDNDNNPWVSTNNGISKLDVKENKFISFYQEDGLQSNEFNGGAYYKNHKGEFLFGGINGLNIFNPNDLKNYNLNEKVVIDEICIEGEIYKDIDNIKLNYYDNMIKFKFFLPNYKNKKNVQYYYKIEGEDNEWHTTNNNQVIYNNLSFGKYEFKIKARDHNGIMSEESSINFMVDPPFWLSTQAYILYIVLIAMIVYSNISKMKRLDKSVAKKTKELNEEMIKNRELFDRVLRLEKNKNNYFVNLSHELRTPLNVISTTEQLITSLNKKEEGVNKEKLNYHMSIMRKNTKRLLNLINNIIDTNKVEHGNYKLNIKEHDIVYIVEETALSMKDHIEKKGIKLTIDPDIEEKIIQCDKNEIERCIVNLLSNASKFTPNDGEIDLLIKDLGDAVEITIKDTGIGIDLKHHEYIFDRFNQIIDENAEIKGGSGLGLTITKHIIDLHGGQIWVESEVSLGSEFKIILNSQYKEKKNI